jgi:small-conductance mechanosensitive channel
MLNKIFIAIGLFIISSALWFAGVNFDLPYSTQLVQSAFTISVLYTFFEVFLLFVGGRQIKEAISAYRFRKSLSIIFYVITILALFRIWVEDPQALLVSYGIVAAGAAIALQDLIKNLAGGIMLLANNLFGVGDRIEIEEAIGDVIDIGLFNTTILEIQNWIEGDQATGRIVSIPNGVFLSKQAVNYTRDHDFIWDELMIPITYASDWKKASKLLKDMAKRRTKESMEIAENQLKRLSRKFYIAQRDTSPQVYLATTDNWIEVRLRYITHARQRRLTKTQLSQSILTMLDNHKDISIASTTLDIIGFPGVKKK